MSGTKYVIHSKRVDQQTVIRKHRVLTRDVCNVCGYSVCDVGNLPPFDTLSESKQEEVKEVLRAHKEYAHPNANKTVFTEDQIPSSFLPGQIDDSSKMFKGWQSDRRVLLPGED